MGKNTICARLQTACLIALCIAIPGAAHAQTYPAKSVRFVIGLTAGSSSDITIRIIGQKLTELWRQNAVVDNRPGAGGNIAAELVAKAPPDGYTLLFWNVGLAIAHSYYPKLPYNALSDFVPVSLATSMPQVACVAPSLPARSIKDLIALAKSRPGEVLFSSAGNGQADHMAGELFAYMAKVKLTHVPFKGGPPALLAVMTGEVALDFPGLAVALSHIQAGKVRALAVTTAKRAPALPDIPTIAESGVPGYQQSIWSGVFAPAATPRRVVAKIGEDMIRAVKSTDTQKRLSQVGVDAVGDGPAEFDAFFKSEVEKWRRVVKATGIQGDL